MTIPLQIVFKDLDPSPALEALIREKAERLERFASRITGCRVTIEMPHHRQAKLYNARIEVLVPHGEVAVTREGLRNHAHEHPSIAVRDAFDAAVRQLEDYVRKLDGRVKLHHEQVLIRGRVVRFVAGADYGFILTSDDEEVYFHRNSVAEGAFDRMEVGDAVELEVSHGDQGPQASLVRCLGKRHPAK